LLILCYVPNWNHSDDLQKATDTRQRITDTCQRVQVSIQNLAESRQRLVEGCQKQPFLEETFFKCTLSHFYFFEMILSKIKCNVILLLFPRHAPSPILITLTPSTASCIVLIKGFSTKIRAAKNVVFLPFS